MVKFRDETTGLLYRQEQTSSDYRQVSIQVADPCLPSEATNKQYVDGLETRLNDLIQAIHNGLTADDVAKLLQPLKDAIDALKSSESDDSAIGNRVAQMEDTVAKLVTAGVGTVTIVNQGSVLKYYNLGLGTIAYKDIVLCNRKIVETSITLDLNLGNRDYTPLALRRVNESKKFAESLELPATDLDDAGNLVLYFQGAEHYPVGDLQLVVAIEGGIEGIDTSNILIPPDLIARIEEVMGQPLEIPAAETDKGVVPPPMPATTASESVSTSDDGDSKKKAKKVPHELRIGEGSIDLDSQGNIIWHIGGVPFINGRASEICTTGVGGASQNENRLYRNDSGKYYVTGIDKPNWESISQADYQAAAVRSGIVARPRK